MIHGVRLPHTSDVLGCAAGRGAGAGMVAAESSWLRSAGDVQTRLGCQTFRKAMRQAIEISDAPMSTIHGLMKFEIRNCGIANDTPHTRIAGQISIMPRKPANTQISQNGTISEKNGSWRPTMAARPWGSRPVTQDRPALGVPSAP